MPEAPGILREPPAMADRARTDWLPAVLVGLYMLASAATNFFLPVYFRDGLGFSGAQIGLLFAAQAIAGVLAAVPTGFINDRVASRTVVAASLLVQAGALALLGLLGTFWPYLLAFALFSSAFQVFRVSLDAQVLKTDEGKRPSPRSRGGRMGSRLGLYQAWRFGGLGIGTFAAGFLMARLDFPASLLAVAATCLPLAALCRGLAPTRIERVRLSDYGADLTKGRVVLFALWMFAFATHWGAETTSYGLFLRENLRLSMVGMGWYMGAEFIAIAGTVLAFGYRMDGGGERRTFAIVGLAASGVGHVGMVFAPLALSAAFRALHGAGDGLIFLIMYLGIAELFAIERRGGNAGFIGMVTMLGQVAGSLVYGPLGEAWGYGVPLWTSGAITLALAAPLLWRRPAARLERFETPVKGFFREDGEFVPPRSGVRPR